MYILYLPTIAIFLLSFSPVYSNTEIVNNISVQTNTGNVKDESNFVSNDTKSSVDIKTVVNGETVDEIHKTSSANIKINNTITAKNTKATITTSINGKTETKKYDFGSTSQKDTNATSVKSDKLSEIISEEDDVINVADKDTSLFKHFLTTFSQTFKYVLSNFFTFSWTSK
jgi:hypothetical protein